MFWHGNCNYKYRTLITVMIRKTLILILLPLMALYANSCRKGVQPHPPTHRGVVLYDVCGNIVIQSLGPNYLGQDHWVDENNDTHPVYEHVFRVANPCDFGEHATGDTIGFNVTGPVPQYCAQCKMYVATPDAAFYIREVK